MVRKRTKPPKGVVTQAAMKQLLHYDPATGIFTRLRGGRWNQNAGIVAGTKNKNWYIRIYLMGAYHHAHRLAWLYMTGEWPAAQIDHINRDKADNRWCNLREATPRQNLANKGAQANSNSGVRGVHYYNARDKWVPYIQAPTGKLKRLGYYDTMEEARAVRIAAAKALHGEFADDGEER